MAIKIAEGFDYNGSSPNFARDQFATLAAMKSFPTTSIDEGHISYCVEDGKTYQYKSSNESDDTTGQWAEFSGSGGSGSGSGFYNVTLLHPLGSGFYTLTTAIAALEDATIDDTEKWAMIITFETSAGTWEDYRFSGTSLDSFTTVAAWAEYGGAGAIKKITISSGTEVTPYTPDGDGAVVIPIPETAVDESMDSNSTNPVQNKAVVAAMANLTSECIVKFETETDSDEVTTLYGYNAEEEVVSSVTLPAGGGTTATTKIQLTRLSASQTVKSGDDVKLTYWFDHIDSETSESTGNSGEATITITYGATTSTLTQTLTAGTNNTIDVTGYMGVGTNTVKVKVTVTDGETVQTSTVSWTITVIQLTLTSTYNWVSSISKGDTITVPYALTGSGTKTLKCYVDGVEYDDKSITTSTSNGSFSVSTSSLAHGSHSIQMVCELELSTDSIIKSNSIYFDVAVRESGNTTPIIATRFDYSDGTIIGANATPYLPVTQYDLYELNYAAYNPKETPTSVIIIEGDTTVSTASVTFTQTTLSLRAMSSGEAECSITCGATVYNYTLNVSQSELNLSEPTDGLVLKLDAQGRSNSDTNKEEWSYGDVTTSFEGFKWGGDGWVDNALRLSANARATVNYQPLGQTTQNTSNSFAFMVKYMVTDVTDDEATVISCLDSDGTGFEITTNEARMMTKGNSSLSMMMEAGSVYEVGFVSYPISSTNSSDHEKLNTEMVYLYINGIMSGCVQRGSGDNIYQTNPQYISMGSSSATTDVYMVRCYNSYLSDDQMLNCYILDQDSSDEMFDLYNANDIVDGNGDVTVDSIPDDMRYVIVTGAQSNGVSTIMQAAVNNDKSPYYDVDEILCVKRSQPELNFRCTGGAIRLQGTSSLAYPIKNYRIYLKNKSGLTTELYLGCDSTGVGGTLQESNNYSFLLADSDRKTAAPVNCFCLKADFAESSSSHNTGLARIANDALVAASELTPVQRDADTSQYEYDIRTTVDGEPCLLFYRNSTSDSPTFLGKFNFNNDKSTEAVFGFCDIPGYHDNLDVIDFAESEGEIEWDEDVTPVINDTTSYEDNYDVRTNPTECWEFKSNDTDMGKFLDDDFESLDNGTPAWLNTFEARYPDDNDSYESGDRTPYHLKKVVSWVKSTEEDLDTFKDELADYFDVNYLCDYFMMTQIFGCVDQMVKNAMIAFFYDPDTDKKLGYYIFYDNDTILGVRNDGRLKYDPFVDRQTIDTELSTDDTTIYAYAGHDSVLWNNLEAGFQTELAAAYVRLRAVLDNDTIFNMFDTEQSAKYCERLYNLDAQYKYVSPKTLGVEVTTDGTTSTVQYSYLEAMQGSRQAHRHWWVMNRMYLQDAKYSTGTYSATDVNWKGTSAAGATVKATPTRDFYFEFIRESETMTHDFVEEGDEWSYTYGSIANVGTIFHLLGGVFMQKLDVSSWGGFTDFNLPTLPVLTELIMGKSGTTYTLSELVIGTKLPKLVSLDIRNYTGLSSLDLSGCNLIEEVNASGCTSLATIAFAEGCSLNTLTLPSNYQNLTLRSLSELTRANITFDNKSNITNLWVENCSQLDGFDLFEELFATGGLERVRLTDVVFEGTGSDLKTWYDAGLAGIDSDGYAVTACKLIGSYQLTSYMDETLLATYADYFDELNIRQPQYTMIEFDDNVSDDQNVSNLDNGTGYKYGTDYVPNAHISALLAQRYRCLGKQAVEGTMTIFPLHDSNSNYYADAENVSECSAASLSSTEGDVFVFEPKYWYKGINDFANDKHYSCYSTNEDMPDCPEATVLTLAELEVTSGNRLLDAKSDLESSFSTDSSYSVCKVDLTGYSRVRYPTAAYSLGACGIFVDADGTILETTTISTLELRFEDGLYLITDVPTGATTLYFTIANTAEFDCVVLSNSSKIEDMEPDWCFHEECLVGLFESSIVNSKLRSGVTGVTSAASLSWDDFNYYSAERKMQQIDYEQHKHIANLFYAKYGRRDSQGQCGYGQNSNTRVIGGTAVIGMQDTVNVNDATQYAWYETVGSDGTITYTQLNNINCLGYEDIYGSKYEMMDNVSVPNDTGNTYKWLITMPDGSQRKVKAGSTSQYISAVAHGKYMDVVPVGTTAGSATTHYCDYYYASASTGRVVYRSHNYANTNGGVSCASASYGSSSTSTSFGSRLAFRGIVVKAASVSAYKALTEIA